MGYEMSTRVVKPSARDVSRGDKDDLSFSLKPIWRGKNLKTLTRLYEGIFDNIELKSLLMYKLNKRAILLGVHHSVHQVLHPAMW